MRTGSTRLVSTPALSLASISCSSLLPGVRFPSCFVLCSFSLVLSSNDNLVAQQILSFLPPALSSALGPLAAPSTWTSDRIYASCQAASTPPEHLSLLAGGAFPGPLLLALRTHPTTGSLHFWRLLMDSSGCSVSNFFSMFTPKSRCYLSDILSLFTF